jgi:uncharacterized protein YkwD
MLLLATAVWLALSAFSAPPSSGTATVILGTSRAQQTMARLLRATVREQGGSIRSDPVLMRLAQGLAEGMTHEAKSQADESIAQVRELLWEQGVADHQLAYGTAQVSPERDASLSAQLILENAGVVLRDYNRMGVSVLDGSDGVRRVAIVLLRRLVETKGELGRTFRFTPEPGFRDPRVVVAGPDGRVREARVEDRGGGTYAADVPASGDGLHKVEVLVDGPRGTEVALLFPVGVDTGLERPLSSWDPLRDLSDTDRLRALIDSERQQLGLQALAWDEAAASIARFHAREMQEQGFGHRLGSGDPQDRMRVASIPFTRVSENLAVADSIEEAHLLLMSSPGHRANVLDHAVTHLGLAVLDGAERFPNKVLVVQILYRAIEFHDPGELEAAALRMVHRTRDAQGFAALDRRKRLDKVARERLAGAVDAEDPTHRSSAAQRAMADLRFHHGDIGEVVSDLLVVESVEGVTGSPALLHDAALEFGLAVMQPRIPGHHLDGLVWICLVVVERTLPR